MRIEDKMITRRKGIKEYKVIGRREREERQRKRRKKKGI